MGYLIDTSVLVRLANGQDAQHTIAANSIFQLHRQGEATHVAPQNLIEFRSAATRPLSVNGLGLSISEVDAIAAGFEAKFTMLPETPAIYHAWKSIVQSLGVIGKQVHDARLVAICHVHLVTHILTFNSAHFSRFAALGPGINVVDPRTVVIP